MSDVPISVGTDSVKLRENSRRRRKRILLNGRREECSARKVFSGKIGEILKCGWKKVPLCFSDKPIANMPRFVNNGRMTYGRFHCVFNGPLLLVLIGFTWRMEWSVEVWKVIAIVLAIVMLFTTGWDNYAVWKGIWGFPRERYIFRIGCLPLEEYLFFVLQSAEVIMLTYWMIGTDRRNSLDFQYAGGTMGVLGGLFALWVIFGISMRGVLKRVKRWHYGWHLLYWFVPVVLLQWIIGWNVLLPRWDWVLIPTLIVGTYLSWADFMAIGRGIWHFDEKQILGIRVAGVMPWEEVAFFYITSLLVAQSFLLLLPESLR